MGDEKQPSQRHLSHNLRVLPGDEANMFYFTYSTFLRSLLQNFQELRKLHGMTADMLNLSNQESTCIALFHDHKCPRYDTSISGCIQRH